MSQPEGTIERQRLILRDLTDLARDAVYRWGEGLATRKEAKARTDDLAKELYNPRLVDPLYAVRPSWKNRLLAWRTMGNILQTEMKLINRNPDDRPNRIPQLVDYLDRWGDGFDIKDG